MLELKKWFNQQKLVIMFTICLMILLSFSAVQAQAVTLHVYQSCVGLGPEEYCDIQTAINAAGPGDIVYIHNGTYVISSTLDIAKDNISIRGESESGVIINSSVLTGYIFNVGGSLLTTYNNITLEYFTLTGNPAGATNYGLKIANIINIDLNHITVTNTRRTAVDLNGVYTGTINNLTLSDVTWGVGLALTDSSNLNISNITTNNNAWGAIALYASTYYPPPGVNTVVFSGTNSLDEVVKIYTEGAVGDFYDIDFGEFNQFMAQNLPTQLNHKYYFDTLTNAQTFLALVTPSTNRVLTNLTTGSKLVYPNMSIQTAIDAASVGDEVLVTAGTYIEQVNVDKRVLLRGVGNVSNPASNTIITFTNAAVIEISGSGLSQVNPLSIENIRIEPVNTDGITVNNGNSISNIVLQDLSVVGTGQSQCTNEQESGLHVDTFGSIYYLWVTDSSFTNLDYGWYFHKHGDMAGNSNVQYITVERVSVSDNMNKGMYIEKLSDAIFTDLVANNNGEPYACFWNANWNAGIDINLKGMAYQNLEFYDLTVTGNALGFLEGVGITIKARDDGGTYGADPASLTGVTIDGAIITGNERGIRMGEPNRNNAGPLGVVIVNAELHSNTPTGMGGSTYGDLINRSQAEVDARNNSWGDNSGPSGGNIDPVTNDIANGTGGYVGVDTRFSPWLSAAPSSGTGTNGSNTLLNEVFTLPKTGFVPNQITKVSLERENSYVYSAIILDIPKIKITSKIVGVSLQNGEWDIRQIGSNIAFLQGTSFPTYAGNTVLTGHVYDATGAPGIFHDLNKLKYNDFIRLEAWNQTYTYKVVNTMLVDSNDTSVLAHQEYDFITLITCQGFDQETNLYKYRYIVQAVLISIEQ